MSAQLVGFSLPDLREELEARASGGMVTDMDHLQGGVFDAEPPVEHLLQFAPQLVTTPHARVTQATAI